MRHAVGEKEEVGRLKLNAIRFNVNSGQAAGLRRHACRLQIGLPFGLFQANAIFRLG
jgi:hypothetical protein